MIKKYIKRIKELRLKKKISQEEMAKELGISRTSYIAIEKGKKELTIDQAKKLADILGFNLVDFIENKENKKKKYEQMLFAFLRLLEKDKKIPKIKLAKLLYLADFAWFYENYESMSGLQYRRIKYGPVPNDYFVLLEELDGDGKIKIEANKKALLISETRTGEKVSDDLLSAEEKKLIKKIHKKWEGKNTKEIVDFAHSQIPHTFVEKGEIIPYGLITQEDPEHVY